jgi:hypothetical protein
MKKSIYILFSILLSACTATTIPTSSATPKIIGTATPKASDTPTVAVTATVTVQAATSIPTPSIQASYNLPGWMAKPNTNIVATITNWKNSTYQLTFFGENVDEKYEMVIPETLMGYFWQDSTHFGFLDHNTVYILNLQTGKTSSQTIPSESLRFLKYQPVGPDVTKALVISKPITASQDFFFVFAYEKNQFSNDWEYYAREDYSGDEKNIILENINTSETYIATDPEDHLWDINMKWSNHTPAQLAILQSKSFPEGRAHGDQIIVVNPSRKETTGTYIDDYAYDFEWSPDDKKFLFEKYEKDAPCIFYREENKHRCVYGISSKGDGVFKWSRDQKNILFEYYTYDSSNGDNFSGNFCQFNLENGITICPTKEIDELKHNAIKDYQISPDGRYVILQLECSALGMDFACNPIHALMSLDGKNFRILDQNYYKNIGYIGTEELLWRPIP